MSPPITMESLSERGTFATTHWSVVLAASDTAIPGARAALEKLCRTYWYPLYAYVRRRGPDAQEASGRLERTGLEGKRSDENVLD
ncbi:MAG: hypothetical protein HY674_11000 [Chloroflexi bacterium]|nr:hypothetical protein [Chloroflexota bacterium]